MKDQERGRLRNDLTSGVKHQKSKLLLDDKSTTMINKAATQLKDNLRLMSQNLQTFHLNQDKTR